MQVAQKPDLLITNDKFYFHPVGVFRALYNVHLSDKCENILK